MTDRTCLLCDEPVEDVQQIGPVTFVLKPCGHEIDQEIHRDLFG